MIDTEKARDETKTVTIVVNTRSLEWSERQISFEQVVELAFPGQPYDPAGTTVEYSRGHDRDKSLRPGENVRVKNGMIFDVESAIRS
jgi:Multiubiquitin